MVFGFGKKKAAAPKNDDDDDDDGHVEVERRIENIQFLGPANGAEIDLESNDKLARAGLVPAKELISDALARRADTIRIEPKGNAGVIQLLIDGIPYAGGRLQIQRAHAITQMVKLLAGLDIQQRKKPQSGGIRAKLGKADYQLAVDATPVPGGYERLNIRALSLDQSLERPKELGFSDQMRERIRDLTAEKEGLFIIAGPPRAGVTSATVGVLRSVDGYQYSIYSVADLKGRDLIHITPFKGEPGDDLDTTMQRCIRVEADVIYCDPIRDAEYAKLLLKYQSKVSLIAEMPAREGVHALVTLMKWTDPKSVAEGVKVVVSPKLIRLLCSGCRMAYRPNPKLLQKLGLPPETKTLYRPRPPRTDDPEYEECRKCGGVGYQGRTGVYQFIEMTEGLKKVIAAGGGEDAITAVIKKEKMQTRHHEGLRLAAEGRTSLEEVQRAFKG